MHTPLPRLIALYLPQFHPIPENDKWWGKGFTEWTNTAKAKPRFRGHYQPHIPADLGYYDLRLPETRAAQAELASIYGIEGFCYYHYWFGNGRRVLEKPLEAVLSSGEPDFPFCICWANESWSGIWHGEPKRVLMPQTYPGPEDDAAHFITLLPAFKDHRYMCVDGKPIFVIYRPFDFPDTRQKIIAWRTMAMQAGLPGLHFVGVYRKGSPAPEDYGFDASIYSNNPPMRSWGTWRNPVELFRNHLERRRGIPTVHAYEKAIKYHLPDELPLTRYPLVVHAWDNSPRSGVNAMVLQGSTPDLFQKALRKAFELTRDNKIGRDGRLIFLKSWNEWAEGNHLEPDLRDGHGYLEAVRAELAHENEVLLNVTPPTALGTNLRA